MVPRTRGYGRLSMDPPTLSDAQSCFRPIATRFVGDYPNKSTSLHELLGPAIPQVLQLARYQALRSINKDVVEVDENDVISQKPTPEEERIMVSNAAVVSAFAVGGSGQLDVSEDHVSSFVDALDSL